MRPPSSGLWRAKGDAAKGKALFKAQSCSACHTDADGQTLKGPHMVDIGKRYSAAELVESILKPSAKIAQGFETYLFEMADGKVYNGFVVSTSAKAVLIREATGVQRELKLAQIESRTIQKQSMMPDGSGQQPDARRSRRPDRVPPVVDGRRRCGERADPAKKPPPEKRPDSDAGADDRAGRSQADDGASEDHVAPPGAERQQPAGGQRGQLRRGEGQPLPEAARPAGAEERQESHDRRRCGGSSAGRRSSRISTAKSTAGCPGTLPR